MQCHIMTIYCSPHHSMSDYTAKVLHCAYYSQRNVTHEVVFRLHTLVSGLGKGQACDPPAVVPVGARDFRFAFVLNGQMWDFAWTFHNNIARIYLQNALTERHPALGAAVDWRHPTEGHRVGSTPPLPQTCDSGFLFAQRDPTGCLVCHGTGESGCHPAPHPSLPSCPEATFL